MASAASYTSSSQTSVVASAGVAMVATVIACWAFALATFSTLPDRFPAHFNAAGAPDRYADKSMTEWLLLPILVLVLSGLLAAVALLIPRWAKSSPEIVSIPSKDKFLALPGAARVRVLEPLQVVLFALAAANNALFFYVQSGTYLIAIGSWKSLSPLPILVLLVVEAAVLTLGLRRVGSRIAHESAEHSQ